MIQPETVNLCISWEHKGKERTIERDMPYPLRVDEEVKMFRDVLLGPMGVDKQVKKDNGEWPPADWQEYRCACGAAGEGPPAWFKTRKYCEKCGRRLLLTPCKRPPAI